MGEKVTLTRPDGSQLNVPAEDAEQFKALGYSPETANSAYARNIEEAKKEHFESPGQRAITALEGGVNGLTVGLYDLANGYDEDEAERARYNPGTRLASELIGGLAPTLVAPESALGKALSLTPAGLLGRGAEAIAGVTTATRTGHALVKGAVEGAGFGAGAEVTNARLSGDPITAESVIAGMGWGALWGGGLGYLSSKAGVKLEQMAAEKVAAERASVHGLIPEENWSSFRGAMEDARKTSGKLVDDAVAAIRATPEEANTVAKAVLEKASALEEEQGALFNRIDAQGGFNRGSRKLKNEIISTRKAFAKAAEEGDYGKFEELTQRHTETMKALADLTKVSAPEVEPFVASAATTSGKAAEDLKSLKAVSQTLEHFPATPEGFSRMTSAKLEKQMAAVETFMKKAPAELAGQVQSLQQTIDDVVAATGITADGSPSQKMKAAWEAMRSAGSSRGAAAAEELKGKGFAFSTAKYVGGRSAGKAGFGFIGKGAAFRAGASLVGGLLSLKSQVLGKLSESVLAWGPGVAKAVQKVSARVDPLVVRLDGSIDGESKGRKELMAARMKEIREAGPTIRDTIYRAVEPAAAEHQDFAVAMHRAAVAQFDALASRMPRDPGTAFNAMKSLWHPDAVMTEQFARAYEVFHNPVGVAQKWLENPKTISPEGARALRDMNPELFTHLRVEMLNRLSQPGVLDKMTYSEQVGLGQLLDITIHSSQDPRFIEAQQQMFAERSQPLPMRGQNSSNNPSGVSRSMTPAQRITDH